MQLWLLQYIWSHGRVTVPFNPYSISFFFFPFLLYNIVLVLPYINMNPPWVYTCSPSWTPCTIPLGRLSAPAPSIQYHASNLDWWFITYMILYIIGDWNAKVGSQETAGVTGKFGLGVRNEAGQRLIQFCQKNALHSKHPFPTTQKTLHMDITRWSTPKSDWLYSFLNKFI